VAGGLEAQADLLGDPCEPAKRVVDQAIHLDLDDRPKPRAT
jgi:hypothetical protein